MYGKRKILIWLIMITIVAMFPILSADASGSEKTLNFKEFLQEVVESNGNFDGGGVLVRWEPNEAERKIDRIQSSNAQYQIFRRGLVILLSPISTLNIFPLISMIIRIGGAEPTTGLHFRSVTRNFNFSTKEM